MTSNSSLKPSNLYAGIFSDIIIPEIRKIRREFSMPRVKNLKKSVTATEELDSKNLQFSYEPSSGKKITKSFMSVKVKIHSQGKKRNLSCAGNSQLVQNKSPSINENIPKTQSSPILPKTLKPHLTNPMQKLEADFNMAKNVKKTNFSSSENTNFPVQNNREVSEDPFYYGNIIKNCNFSAFKSLFDGNSDLITISYPHKWKKGKVIVKPKPSQSVSKISKLNRIINCRCQNHLKKNNIIHATQAEIKESLPTLREVKKTINTLYRIHFFPQKAQCFRNLVLVNFDGTFGQYKSSFTKKKGTWKVLRALSTYFQIVIIVHNKSLKDQILQVIESKKIIVSGVYCVNENPGVLKRCSRFLDYSQIYFDFEITTPNRNCLVLSCHYSSEISDNPEEVIFDCLRPFGQLLVPGVPVASSEFIETPFVLVVNSIGIESDCKVFQGFFNGLAEFFVNFRCFRDCFDFSQFFYRLGYNVFKTIRAHHMFLDFIDGHLLEKDFTKEDNKSRQVFLCMVHNRYYKQFRFNKPANYFVLI